MYMSCMCLGIWRNIKIYHNCSAQVTQSSAVPHVRTFTFTRLWTGSGVSVFFCHLFPFVIHLSIYIWYLLIFRYIWIYLDDIDNCAHSKYTHEIPRVIGNHLCQVVANNLYEAVFVGKSTFSFKSWPDECCYPIFARLAYTNNMANQQTNVMFHFMSNRPLFVPSSVCSSTNSPRMRFEA